MGKFAQLISRIRSRSDQRIGSTQNHGFNRREVNLACDPWLGFEPLEPRVLLHAVDPVTGLAHDHGVVEAVDVSMLDQPFSTLAHPDDPQKQIDHDTLLDLVKYENVTHTAVADGGLWSQADTWADIDGDSIGDIPDAGADVLIPESLTVVFDLVSTTPLHTIRVDGVLDFATQQDTQLLVDTLVVSPVGTLEIGTKDDPIADSVNAVIVIADSGPIDTGWDPTLLSRGLISHGSVSMYGSATTAFAPLAKNPSRGDNTLELSEVPTNWKPGDRLVLTGSYQNQDEELQIASISGNVVTTVESLAYNHPAPDGQSVYVANLSRNIVVMSENPQDIDRRGHVMFMHSPDVDVNNVGFYGLGRTDKRSPVDDPELDANGQLIDGTGLNPRARYAVHIHRSGADINQSPATVRGSVVVDSPGWGYVNHDSYAVMEDNVAFDVVGAAFVTENGNEIGAFRRNIAIKSTGSGDSLTSREELHDFGHNGHGFWLQGGGVEVEDNVASGQNDAAFIFFTRSKVARFLAANLPDPSIAGGAVELAVGSVPILKFKGNTAFASKTGFESWFHLLSAKHDQRSVVEDFTVWNTRRQGLKIPYTNQMTLRNVQAIGNVNRPRSVAIARNNVTRNINYENLNLEGWTIGIDVARNGRNVIEGGSFNNVYNILISTTNDRSRVVDINGDIKFGTLSDDALRGRTQRDIAMKASFSLKDKDIAKLFSPDAVRLGTVRYNGKQLYYNEQAYDFVPFKAGDAADYIPTELIGKTNQELWDQYGLAIGGTVAPTDAVTDPRIKGLIGDPTTYLPNLKLRSRKYTNQLDQYQLAYRDVNGKTVRDDRRVDLQEGWNLITREIDGQARTFFVYGDVTGPTFTISPKKPLVINPAALHKGFKVKGTVFDDSFGKKRFRKTFSGRDLQDLEVQTRSDGSQFLLLEFSIRDRAGNTTKITLELTLDTNASLNPLGPQKKLKKRVLSRSLLALVSDYYKRA